MQETPLSPALESADCNCLALRQAARHVSQIYDAHLAPVGLKTTQYSILAKLNRLGPLSINELAKLMVMDRTTLGRAVRPLERDKLLAIGGDDDGRKRSLKLTTAGQARLKAAAAKWREAQKEFELTFGVSDSAKLRTALQRVVAKT
jgi:DNA-binding MarR family transcriptional regulator